MNQLYGQLKFIKACEKGFYLCFGSTYIVYNEKEMKNFAYVSPAEEVIPQKIHSFSYDLEEFWSMDLEEYFSKDSYANDISLDEDDYLLIPIFIEKTTNEAGEVVKNARILFKVADLKQEVAKINLMTEELNDYKVNSLKIKYDLVSKTLRGILIISEPSETNPRIMNKWGYMYAEWKEDGTLIKSNITWLNKNDLLNQGINEYLVSENIADEEISTFNLDSNVGFFNIQDNGDVLYIANNIFARITGKLENTKFILCISNKGNLKWTRTIPYSNNACYKKVFYFINQNQLHIFSREFTQNFASGSYVFRDINAPANGKTILMSDRIIDLNTGEVISHKPIFEGLLGKYEPYWNIFEKSKNKFIIRYRNSKANSEKWVVMEY